MRMLLLLRGLPASGKSTFIKENNLIDYTVSSDNLRIMLGGSELTKEGKVGINQGISGKMWNTLNMILEERFKIGAFTILDATNIKGKDMTSSYNIAKKYKYRVYCLDFTDVSMDECIERDKNREEHKVVGAEVIERMYNDLQNNKVPGGIKVIKPSEWLSETRYREQDISEYTKVHHIGDIHGCNTVLQEYLKEGIKEDEFYIFIGDYVDRGIENAGVIDFLYTISGYPNVVLLEGNHEIHGRNWINGYEIKSSEFIDKTLKEFIAIDEELYKKKIKRIDNNLRQCFIYKYNEKVVLCTHGGLSSLPENLSLINTQQMIKGVGSYGEMLEVCHNFKINMQDKPVYQVFGHRNIEQVDTEVNERCFNINGSVEFGGNLRSLVLDKSGFTSYKTVNSVYAKPYGEVFVRVEDMLDIMKENEFVKFKNQEGTDIVSLNFTREAFYSKVWNGITTKARGLFINTSTNTIVARAYEKFFNLNEQSETTLDVIPNRFKYPVRAFKKENGFLGILGYDEATDQVLYCSKSEINGEYSTYFKDLLLSFVSEDKLREVLVGNNVSLLFEVVDIENDPHIIQYSESTVILLDIVENTIKFQPKSFIELCEVANKLNLRHKEEYKIFFNKEDFTEFLDESTKENYSCEGDYIEGFVFEDTHKNMVKVKTEYYNKWKYLRTQLVKMSKGGISKIEDDFLVWVSEDKLRYRESIIDLREKYNNIKEFRA